MPWACPAPVGRRPRGCVRFASVFCGRGDVPVRCVCCRCVVHASSGYRVGRVALRSLRLVCLCVVVGSPCSMPANAIPLSLDAAFVMNLRDFILVLDDSGEEDAVDSVVAILHDQHVRSTRRLASCPVRCFRTPPAPVDCWACRPKIWSSALSAAQRA